MLDVKIMSPEEADKFLKEYNNQRGDPRRINLGFGMSLKGSCDIVCRDAQTGEIAWQQTVDNVVTDYGRRVWFLNLLRSSQVLANNNTTEQPDYRRYSINGDPNSNNTPISAAVDGGYSTVTQTKTWTPAAFGTPSANRTIGMVALGSYNSGFGPWGLWAYLMMSPPKTQTTTQTLELVYKVSFSPIV